MSLSLLSVVHKIIVGVSMLVCNTFRLYIHLAIFFLFDCIHLIFCLLLVCLTFGSKYICLAVFLFSCLLDCLLICLCACVLVYLFFVWFAWLAWFCFDYDLFFSLFIFMPGLVLTFDVTDNCRMLKVLNHKPWLKKCLGIKERYLSILSYKLNVWNVSLKMYFIVYVGLLTVEVVYWK